jgi:26S proteasome regulatory subunit (ATPase 3-interacting protein)
MSAPPAKKPKTSGNADLVEKSILDYMRAQNRPYSLLNVFDNMHAPFVKAQMQAALERLVAEGHLVVKEYGAQKFFFCPQNSFGDCSLAATAGLEQEINQTRAELADLNAKIAGLLADCPPSDELLRADKAKLETRLQAVLADIKVIQARIDEYAKRADAVTEFDTAIKKFGKVLDECTKRKKICANLLAFVAEQLNVAKPELIDELGLDLSTCCVLNAFVRDTRTG